MWTEAQSSVINSRNNNLLVSAAAGSGKTAVLVERIIDIIANDGVDIEQLVVVTYTRAAASEMKERIREALEAKLEKNHDDARLSEQMTMVGNAKIMTIDSFCLMLIRENFLEAGIDPAFRTAETGEIELIENELLQDIIERHYANQDKAFIAFAECFSPGRSDTNIEKLIMRIYNYSKSYPWPKEWLYSLNEMYSMDGEWEFEELAVVKSYCGYVRDIITDYKIKYTYLIEICNAPNAPLEYVPALEQDIACIDYILDAKNFEELAKRIRTMEFVRLTICKGADEAVKDEVKETRKKFKDVIKKLNEGVFCRGINSIIDEVKGCGDNVAVLTGVAAELHDAVAAKKTEKNVIDFNDMEHIALNLLVKKDEEGRIYYTQTADRLAGEYAYIMVDEYQDSNYLQEYILQAVSGERFNNPNMFMVGDVKQSIYGFRQAVPELFVEKYHAFEEKREKGEKIELQVNFRSRKSVLDAVNSIFFPIMRECVGKIEYTDSVKLNAGAQFEEPQKPFVAGGPCSVLIAGTKAEDIERPDKAQAEAAAVIHKIKEYVSPKSTYVVWDKNLKSYRKPEFKDITILLRNDSGWFETFTNLFMNAGIPVSVEAKGGYFNTIECQIVLNMLACIDNPYQDIPLAGLLVSYFGRFTFEELAMIRQDNKSTYLYDNLCSINESSSLYLKITKFVSQLSRLRKQAGEKKLYDILWEIVHQSGYYEYSGTMPAGEKRQRNLDALLLKAKSYENSQIKGLFNFLRYIEMIGKYNVEYGDGAAGSDENSVRLMTIHKSKGLEFPIVFVCGITRKFNVRDISAPVVVDRDLGIGMYSFNLENRTRKTSFYREAISKKLYLSDIAEEIRVLYVALTRAKEKLILVGNVDDAESTISACRVFADQLKHQNNRYLLADLCGCTDYLRMLLPAALNSVDNGEFEITGISPREISEWISDYSGNGMETYTNTVSENDSTGFEPYPYEKYLGIRSKMSVSEIKKMSHAADSEDFEKPKELFLLPEFTSDGAVRGTAYHRVMECLDYKKFEQFLLTFMDREVVLDEIKAQIDGMVLCGKLTCDAAKTVDVTDIERFVTSELGLRIIRACDTLKREQPFVIGVPAKDLICYSDMPECEELVLIQGVIDLYFTEGSEITLVDYKTDRVSAENGKEILTSRYKKQLDLYGNALERLAGSGFAVKEKVIYSFELGTFFSV